MTFKSLSKVSPSQRLAERIPGGCDVGQHGKLNRYVLLSLLLQVDKPATFSVNFNGAQGTIKGFVNTPSGSNEELFIQEIDNDLNSCRFLPHENGVYYVHLKFNDAHIPSSPFAMLVGKLGADPALVMALGDGLQTGISGA